MNIEDKRSAVQAWMRRNQRRLSQWSILSPDLKSPICSDPLFKPLLFGESIVSRNNAFRDFWYSKLATADEYATLNNPKNDQIISFNLYLEKNGLVHEHHWTGKVYGLIRVPEQLWHITTQYNERHVTYRMCVIENKLRFAVVVSDIQPDGLMLNIDDDHPDSINIKLSTLGLKHLVLDIVAANDRAAADVCFKFMLEAPLELQHIHEAFDLESITDNFFSLCNDETAKVLFLAKYTNVSKNEVESFLNTGLYNHVPTLLKVLPTLGNAPTEACIALPSL